MLLASQFTLTFQSQRVCLSCWFVLLQLLPLVDAALVPPQDAAFVEGLATRTHVWLLPGVRPEVALEALLGSIAAGTLWAPEGLLLGVLGQLVSSQVFTGHHRLSTYFTDQLDIAGAVEALPVGTKVAHTQEGGPTVLAHVLFLPSVCVDVHLEGVGGEEPCAAELARVVSSL